MVTEAVTIYHKKMILLSYWCIFALSVFFNAHSKDLNCGDVVSCKSKSFDCSGTNCVVNCNTANSCDGTKLLCHDDVLHDICTINCYGVESCKNMNLTSYRDTVVNCIGQDSCDSMKIHIYGNNANDKINATIISSGSYTDSVSIECYNDGIGECMVDCQDNGDNYSCIDVDLHCYTKGTCRYHCDTNACCGCTQSCSSKCTQLQENNLRCYEGNDNNNCIQEDPGGCQKLYGCIRRDVFPTPNPTSSPSNQRTKIPTKYPSGAPTWNPSKPPTAMPTLNPLNPTKSPTRSPTDIPTTDPSKDPTNAPTNNSINNPTNKPSFDPTSNPTKNPASDPEDNSTNDLTVHPSRPLSVTPPTTTTTNSNDERHCVPLTITITNLIGVISNAFITDINLQTFVMNSTKFVIYHEITGSFVYDARALCDDFWKCFDLTLLSIHGNTALSVKVCSSKLAVYEALFDKIADSVDEMAAYIRSQLTLYLTAPDNHGYNHANTDNMRISVEMDIITTTETMEELTKPNEIDKVLKLSDKTILFIVALVSGLMFILLASIAFCKKCKKTKRKIKIPRIPTTAIVSPVSVDSIYEGFNSDEGMNINISGDNHLPQFQQPGSLRTDNVHLNFLISNDKDDVDLIENYEVNDNEAINDNDIIETVNETHSGTKHQNKMDMIDMINTNDNMENEDDDDNKCKTPRPPKRNKKHDEMNNNNNDEQVELQRCQGTNNYIKYNMNEQNDMEIIDDEIIDRQVTLGSTVVIHDNIDFV